MKFLVVIFFIVSTLTMVNAQNDLTVTISNVKNDKGVVRLGLFKGENGFPDAEKKAHDTAAVSIRNGKAVYIFKNLPEGNYGISTFHDSDNTGKIRTNVLGIPKDGYGFSNNVMGTFGPPSFKDASFPVKGGKTEIEIKLR